MPYLSGFTTKRLDALSQAARSYADANGQWQNPDRVLLKAIATLADGVRSAHAKTKAASGEAPAWLRNLSTERHSLLQPFITTERRQGVAGTPARKGELEAHLAATGEGVAELRSAVAALRAKNSEAYSRNNYERIIPARDAGGAAAKADRPRRRPPKGSSPPKPRRRDTLGEELVQLADAVRDAINADALNPLTHEPDEPGWRLQESGVVRRAVREASTVLLDALDTAWARSVAGHRDVEAMLTSVPQALRNLDHVASWYGTDLPGWWNRRRLATHVQRYVFRDAMAHVEKEGPGSDLDDRFPGASHGLVGFAGSLLDELPALGARSWIPARVLGERTAERAQEKGTRLWVRATEKRAGKQIARAIRRVLAGKIPHEDLENTIAGWEDAGEAVWGVKGDAGLEPSGRAYSKVIDRVIELAGSPLVARAKGAKEIKRARQIFRLMHDNYRGLSTVRLVAGGVTDSGYDRRIRRCNAIINDPQRKWANNLSTL